MYFCKKCRAEAVKKTDALKSSYNQHQAEKQRQNPKVDISHISSRGMYKKRGNKGQKSGDT